MINKYSLILVMFYLVGINSYGQNLYDLNGYKIIYLPYEFNSLVNSVEVRLKEIGLKVYRDENQLKSDSDFKSDPSLTLQCKITHDYNYPHTTIGIQLINAINAVIFERTESTRGKSFVSFNVESDEKWVVERIFREFDNFKYQFDGKSSLSKRIEENLPVLELTGLTEDSIKSYLTTRKIDLIEGIYKSYQSDGMPYYKIGIVKIGSIYKAVILDSELAYWKRGELKAIFEQSSMKGLYSTTWYMGNKTPYETFATMDNAALLIIELKDQKTGEKRQDEFIKMFPSTDDEVTFKKDNSKSSGSGFLITTDGILATNAHVVQDASNIEVIISNELGTFTYVAKILLMDTKNDVALLKIEDENFKGLTSIPFGITENSDVGSKVFTIGYPLNDVMGSNYKVTDGIISAKTGIADDVRYYQISVPLQPGNSGGPLFNREGNVIGITSARLNGKAIGTQIENVNYAIKSSYLLNLYNMIPNSTKPPATLTLASKELHEQVKVLKNYVCLIKVY
jgi:S1-C subfamily serine protease